MAPSCSSLAAQRGEKEQGWGDGGEGAAQGLNSRVCGSLSATVHPLASTLDERLRLQEEKWGL